MADKAESIEAQLDTPTSKKQASLYRQIIQRVFDRHYQKGQIEFRFERTELTEIATALHSEGLVRKSAAKNLGDIVYTFRHRQMLPEKILATQPKGKGWIILGDGDAKYRFRLTGLVLMPFGVF